MPLRSATRTDTPQHDGAGGVGSFLASSLAHEAANRAPTVLWPFAMVLWVATVVAAPSLESLAGSRAVPYAYFASYAAATIIALSCRWRASSVWISLIVTSVLAWTLASFAVDTGLLPPDPSRAILAPRGLAVESIIAPIARAMALVAAWGVADMLFERDRGWASRMTFAAVAAAVFGLWGAHLVVPGQGGEVWTGSSLELGDVFHGIAGWAAIGFVLTLVVRPLRLPRIRLGVVYLVGCLFVGADVIATGGRSVAAVVAFSGMAVVSIAAWAAEFRRWRRAAS